MDGRIMETNSWRMILPSIILPSSSLLSAGSHLSMHSHPGITPPLETLESRYFPLLVATNT